MYEKLLYFSNYALIYELVSSIFPKENIFIVNGDTLVEDPLVEIKKVEHFLGISPSFKADQFIKGPKGFPCFNIGEVSCMKSNKGREHSQLKNETKEFLKRHFQPIMDKFEQQTGIQIKQKSHEYSPGRT